MTWLAPGSASPTSDVDVTITGPVAADVHPAELNRALTTAAVAAPMRLRSATTPRRPLVIAPTAADLSAAFPEAHVQRDMSSGTDTREAPIAPPAASVARPSTPTSPPPTPAPTDPLPDLDDPATAERVLLAVDRDLLEDVFADMLCAAARRSGVEV